MYEKFALIYDRVMRGVDYPQWAEYVIDLARKYEFNTDRICDLACGTGSLALLLQQKGHHVHGVDSSAEMLKAAQKKAVKQGGEGLSWQKGTLTDFELDTCFPLVTCLYDSVNYLLSEQAILHCFQKVHQHLQPGGGFIFDITTEYNIIVNFADYTFAENFEDFSYIWENKYNIETKVITSEVTLFQQEEDRFCKYAETHLQKMYSPNRIESLCQKAGLEVLGTFDGFTLKAPGSKIERIHFVCRKQGE